MFLNLDGDFKYGTANYEQYISSLDTNLDQASMGFVDGYSADGAQLLFSRFKLPDSTFIKFKKSELFNLPVKLIARLMNTDGVWWADNFILQDGVVNIDFKSQGESGGSGELKTFSGSLTQDGQPVSRAVYALAIGGDVPKLLASAVSDDMGNYSLEWNGYAGPIIVTATDDYGMPFAAEALLSSGARIHPIAPNGYVYEVTSSGTTGAIEPTWPAVEGESVTSGEVQLVAKPFYRPKSAGPFTIV
tara:strand:+ start:31606 stop:32343 length:738 start_codon:yes stop_codon:yes gene_type:complete